MNAKNKEKLKIEYTIISRGTERYGSKGYMGVTESLDKKRYFVLVNHYEKYIQTLRDSFCFNDEYTIENVTLSRFELIPKLVLQHKLGFVKERMLIYGLGSVGFATLIYLLDLGYKKIDVCVKDSSSKIIYAINDLNIKYKSSINIVNGITENYNTYIEATGSSDAIENIFKNVQDNSVIFLIGTPRENKYLINPLDIHRKNLEIFGGHELNGHNWEERNKAFIELLIKNEDKYLGDFVNIYDYNVNSDILPKVHKKKRNFFEVIRYDIQN